MEIIFFEIFVYFIDDFIFISVPEWRYQKLLWAISRYSVKHDLGVKVADKIGGAVHVFGKSRWSVLSVFIHLGKGRSLHNVDGMNLDAEDGKGL